VNANKNGKSKDNADTEKENHGWILTCLLAIVDRTSLFSCLKAEREIVVIQTLRVKVIENIVC
jgi:hypothetical protein